MLNDALTLVSWRSRPRSFVALMSLYESNYLRLSELAGNLRGLSDVRVSRVADDCDLRLTVTERSPYTTSLDLTYLFPQENGLSTYPDMRVRVYHDARLVEGEGHGEVHALQARHRRVAHARPAHLQHLEAGVLAPAHRVDLLAHHARHHRLHRAAGNHEPAHGPNGAGLGR